MPPSPNTIIAITGANGGLGYEIAKALLQSPRPYHILLGSRSSTNGTAAAAKLQSECSASTSTIEPIKLDLTSDADIAATAAHVSATHGRLDCLVNNAGATFDLEFLAGRATPREQFLKSYDVNVAGTHALTYALAPLLLKSADPRLIFVAGLSSLNAAYEKFGPTPDLPAGWPKIDALRGFDTIGYRCSKTALNMLMLDWNHKLKADGVKVWSAAPGVMATNLGGVPELAKAMGGKDPAVAAAFVRTVVEGERDDQVGKLIDSKGLHAL